MMERVMYARRRKSSMSFMAPVTGGTPITSEIAANLRQVLFGTCMHIGNHDWMKSAFVFHDPRSPFAYGLIASKNSTKPVLMCVQAYVLRHLLFHYRPGSSHSEHEEREALRPTKQKQQEVLTYSLVDIIWKSGIEKGIAIVCLPSDKHHVDRDHNYFPDGVTERLCLYEFTRIEDLQHFISKYIYAFQHETGSGILLLLYSVILSRGIDRVIEDLNDDTSQLLSPMGESTQPIVTLLLSGRATPYLHNGTIYMGTMDTVPKVGVMIRGEVGFLIWKRTEEVAKHVGSRLKTPMLPIWVTNADDHYGVLFNANRDLVRDHRAEHRFDLHYYNSPVNQSSPTILSVDTRLHWVPEEYSTPALEKIILSKWQGSKISWNGSSPQA